MPRLELLHSKEQLFLLDLSQKAEKRCLRPVYSPVLCCRPSRFCVGFENEYLHACAHTGNEEKAGYLNLGERNANYNYILSSLYVLATHYL